MGSCSGPAIDPYNYVDCLTSRNYRMQRQLLLLTLMQRQL